MTENQHERSPIDRPELQKLFVKWLIQLLDERHGVKQRGSSGAERWNIILADDSPVEAEFDSSGQPRVKGPPEYEQELASAVEDASRRTLALDFGSGAWWRASFYTDMGLSGVTMLHFMRLMSEHNPRRFSGGWRLGSEALVYFEQGNTEPTPVSIPKFDVHITFRVSAPGPGPHAEAIAEEVGTFLRAAASFATAAPLLGSPPLFPADEVQIEEATEKLSSVPELPLEGQPLWPQILALAPTQDSVEALRRVQGAIFAYEQAMHQESEYVTPALLVSALEALSVANATWQQERVTTRFFRFVQELCSEPLAEVMSHGNVAQAFGAYNSQRHFINAMYSLRFKPLHTGFQQHRLSALPMGGEADAQIRVMLVSEIVRAGIVEFLRRPFSSLIGHPEIAPSAQPETGG